MNFFWSLGATKKPEAGTPAGSSSPQPGHQQQQQPFKTMNLAFRKGIHYNMKIVLRGDVMTGKTALFQRLQGHGFEPDYTCTSQIQVTNIPWQYKESNDVIKVEIWDVVDNAQSTGPKKSDAGIKLEHDQPKPEGQTPPPVQDPKLANLALDASNVDVYRNTHAAIFLFDTTKQWTFDYVNRELSNVPETMAVLVLGNFCDKSADRVVTLEEIHATLYLHNKDRIERGAIKPNLIRYAESSMMNGMGLKYIYDYLAVPFLQLQIETLKKQLELKAVEIVDTLEVLDNDDKVPETMHRKRGQDNFDQPSEPHLARQQNSLRQAWDDELQEIADDHATPVLDMPSSPIFRKETPPPPLEPVKGRRREGSLVSGDDKLPPAVDQFDAGMLEDDWFKDDPATNDEFSLPYTTTTTAKQDSDNEGGQNPMVASDEDVVSVDYDEVRPSSQSHEIRHTYSQDEHESEEEEKEEQPKFHSELEDVWGARENGIGLLVQPSLLGPESEEDDPVEPDHMYDPTESGGFSVGFGGYEEIGGDNDNPWSLGGASKQEDEDYEPEHNVFPSGSNMTASSLQEAPSKAPSEAPKEKTKSKKSLGSKKKKSKSSGSKKKKNSTLQ